MDEKAVCSRGHAVPSLLTIARSLELLESDILCGYVVGSHAWGGCHARSDWDLLIVAAGAQTRNQHRGAYEARVLSREAFEEEIRAHSMAVLPALWLPPALVLRERFQPRPLFRLRPAALFASLRRAHERDMRVAAKHWGKGNAAQARTVLLHSLRYLEFGTQLLRDGAITDLAAGHAHRGPVLDCRPASWAGLVEAVQPALTRLWGQLAQADPSSGDAQPEL